MRILMFGTGPFAVPTFKAILQSEHEVPLLVTRPTVDSGKRRKSAANPSRETAEAAGVPIFDPPSINTPDAIEKLREFNPDLFVVCDYGQILSRKCLGVARLGGINLHGSLLPKYRGAAPINWAVYHGEETLGITVIHMTTKLDAGPALRFADLAASENETAEDLEPRLSELGVAEVLASIKMLEAWDGESALGEKQDPKLATKAPRLQKSDGCIDWTRTRKQVIDQIRAFQPWPGTYTTWQRQKGQPIRIIVHRAQRLEETPDHAEGSQTESHEQANANLQPGQVCVSNKSTLAIMTADGPLELVEIQPAGKRKMEAAEFLRGYTPAIGDLFQ